MPRPTSERKITPHLDHWVALGFLTSWSPDYEGHWRRWVLYWWDGTVTIWAEREVKAAAVIMDRAKRLVERGNDASGT